MPLLMTPSCIPAASQQTPSCPYHVLVSALQTFLFLDGLAAPQVETGKDWLMWTGSPGALSKLPQGGSELMFDNCIVSPSDDVRSLCMVFESYLGMKRETGALHQPCMLLSVVSTRRYPPFSRLLHRVNSSPSCFHHQWSGVL
jgi:hypothetical protein